MLREGSVLAQLSASGLGLLCGLVDQIYRERRSSNYFFSITIDLANYFRNR
jgi:hypothetical protein